MDTRYVGGISKFPSLPTSIRASEVRPGVLCQGDQAQCSLLFSSTSLKEGILPTYTKLYHSYFSIRPKKCLFSVTFHIPKNVGRSVGRPVGSSLFRSKTLKSVFKRILENDEIYRVTRIKIFDNLCMYNIGLNFIFASLGEKFWVGEIGKILQNLSGNSK